jgi:hypothetical protein
VYGSGKTDLLAAVEKRVRTQVEWVGINIERLYWAGEFRLPLTVRDAIDAKIKATQFAQQRAKEVAAAKAEADKAIEEARGVAESTLLQAKAEAAAIRIKGDALRENPRLVELSAIESGTAPCRSLSARARCRSYDEVTEVRPPPPSCRARAASASGLIQGSSIQIGQAPRPTCRVWTIRMGHGSCWRCNSASELRMSSKAPAALGLALWPCSQALACTLWETSVAREVRVAVLGPDVWLNIGFTVLPFLAIAAVVLGIRGDEDLK